MRLAAGMALAATLASSHSLHAAAPWEVRYGQHGDQKPEWTVQGYVPGWILTALPDGQGLTWTEPADGPCRGWLLVVRPFTVPAAPVLDLTLRLEYRTRCTLDAADFARSGTVWAIAMPRPAWDALARQPAAAAVFDPAGATDCLAVCVHPQGEDVLDWRRAPEVSLGRLPAAWAGQEVLCGIAWGAYHPGNVEEGGFRQLEVTMKTATDLAWEFWDALDLERAELQPVREAVRGRDEPRAVHEFARYLREQPRPALGNPVRPADAAATKRAGETLAHTYRLAGCPVYTFPAGIVWNADPFNYEQWAIALNRHSEWLGLAAAYLRTREETYANEWARQVDAWVAAMPVFVGKHWVEGPYNAAGKAPLSLDAGIRMGQTWFPALDVFRTAAVVPDATLVAVVRSAYDHARYLLQASNFHSGSNWGAMEANGLYHIGVCLPEFRAAGQWREAATARLLAELDAQVYPDGAQVELAPGYHGVTLSNLIGTLRLARANQLALPEAYVAGLERMFECFLKTALPDLTMPPLNDSGRGGIQGHFREAVTLFPNREDFRWALTSRKEGRPPEFTSVAMPYAGWVVMRSDWTPEARYLLFDAGPFGTGHQHEDKLSVILCDGNRMLVADAGTYAYDESAWRRYALSTRGHSTVRVDGRDQNCRRSRGEYRAVQPDTHGFQSTPRFEYARDTHTAGYGEPPDLNVRHRRRVLFVKPDWWVVVDDLAAGDQAEHEAEVQHLVDAPSVEVDEGRGLVLSVAAAPGQARLAMARLGPDTAVVRVVHGQREPEVVGFLPEGFEKLRPAPAVQFRWRFRGATSFACALVPFRGDACPLAAVDRASVAGGFSASLRLGAAQACTVTWTPTALRAQAGAEAFEAQEPPVFPAAP